MNVFNAVFSLILTSVSFMAHKLIHFSYILQVKKQLQRTGAGDVSGTAEKVLLCCVVFVCFFFELVSAFADSICTFGLALLDGDRGRGDDAGEAEKS